MEGNNQTTEVATATNTGQAVSKPPKKKSSMPTIVVIFIVFAAIIGFSFFLCIVYKAIFPYRVYDDISEYSEYYEPETWKIYDIRQLYFKTDSSMKKVAWRMPGFYFAVFKMQSLRDEGESLHAVVPIKYGDYTFTGGFSFFPKDEFDNLESDLLVYYYRGVEISSKTEFAGDFTSEEYDEFIDFIRRDVGCSPETTYEGSTRYDTFRISDSMVLKISRGVSVLGSYYVNFDFES